MAGSMPTIELSPRASADLLDIYLQGIRLFGPMQADRYLDSLESCFSLLADTPRMGRAADHLGAGLRRQEHGSHVIFYEIADGGVFIAAILHERQLPDLGNL